jgi:hypothetical protein
MLAAGFFPATAAAADPAPLKWHPWFEIGGYAGNERSRGEAVLWAPLMQSDRALLFTDIRGKIFEEEQREGNFALGYRQMMSDGWNLGLWTGYDARRTSLGSIFGQVSFGVEALHPWFDVRANAYLPTDDSKIVSDTPIAYAEMTGSDIFLASGQHMMERELAFRGIDGEIGVKVPLDQFALDIEQHELRLYAGAFAFDNDLYDGTIAGPKARMEWRIYNVVPQWYGSRLTFEAEYAWDELRDDQVEAGARLRLPFGIPRDVVRLNAQELRMTEGLERDTDIVAKGQTYITGKQKLEHVEDAITQANYNQVVTVENGNDLQTAVDGAGSNSLIIVKGGTSYTVSGALTMHDRQTLMGGGSTIFVKGLQTGLIVPFSAPGSRPNIVGCACDIIYMDHATRLSGLNLTGIDIDVPDGSQLVAIDNLRMTDSFIAIQIHDHTRNVTIDNVSISDSLAGIGITDDNTVRISNVTISDNILGGIGIGYGNHVTMENVRFHNAGIAALSIEGDNTVSMSNSAISGNTYTSGIEFLDTGNVLSGNGNTHNISGGGVLCDDAAGSQSGSFGFSTSPTRCP